MFSKQTTSKLLLEFHRRSTGADPGIHYLGVVGMRSKHGIEDMVVRRAEVKIDEKLLRNALP
jgi:hypothetical protein